MLLTRYSIAALLGLRLVSASPLPPSVTEGALVPSDPYSKNTGAACPLKHTNVQAEITGFLARSTVTQEFKNESKTVIEAVYVFPLSTDAAVDRMEIRIGDRTIRAVIKKRAEAREMFEAARNKGQIAALLDQERPNIFTQSVTNIPPGAEVVVTLSYIETLKFEEGSYEWSFPMVVGPRYIPGKVPIGKEGVGWSEDTNKVSDASRITPRLAPPNIRAGHDISISVRLDAGVPIESIRSATHGITLNKVGANQATLQLAKKAEIPNKDFVLRYDVTGGKIQDALLFHRDKRGGFFTLVLQPPDRVTVEDVTPKELVFVLDTSGSMNGFPIEKAKETMRLALAGLYPRDTFNFITFAGDTHVLFPHPVPASAENVQKALTFLESRKGSGGTEMMKAIRLALAPSNENGKVRVVCFMTDGYVGNDMEILSEIRKHPGARIFSFGIGQSVNRFLLDKMAVEGRGEVEYVSLQDDGSAAARRFHERVKNPLLTDIKIDWGGLPVSDIYPKQVPDLFSAKPVVLFGRFEGAASGTIRLRGTMSGKALVREIPVNLPAQEPLHDSLASLWARTQIDDLMGQDWLGLRTGKPQEAVETKITELGLRFNLMTQFTSFVAVDLEISAKGGKPTVVETPIEMPDGVNHAATFGEIGPMRAMYMYAPKGVVGGSIGIIGPPAGMPIPRRAQVAPPTHPTKMNSSIRAIFQSYQAGLPPTAAPYVVGDRVAVDVWLAEDSTEVLAALQKLGFVATVKAKVGKVAIGTIPIARLGDVEALPSVLRIEPHSGR